MARRHGGMSGVVLGPGCFATAAYTAGGSSGGEGGGACRPALRRGSRASVARRRWVSRSRLPGGGSLSGLPLAIGRPPVGGGGGGLVGRARVERPTCPW